MLIVSTQKKAIRVDAKPVGLICLQIHSMHLVVIAEKVMMQALFITRLIYN